MPKFEANHDYYAALGVAPQASVAEIRRQYRFLVMAFHPDKYSRNPEYYALAETKVKQINEAYRILADSVTRSRYDTTRSLVSTQPKSSFLASPQELAEALSRAHQLERDLFAAQERLASLAKEHARVERLLAERDRTLDEERRLAQTEQRVLRLQLEQLTRENVEILQNAQLRTDQVQRQLQTLREEVDRREALVQTLTQTKIDWEKSTQSRLEIHAQQMQRLREELAAKEANAAVQQASHQSTAEKLARESLRVRRTTRQLTNAVRAGEAEIVRLQAALTEQRTAHGRHSQIQRLWQIAAAIGLVNTIILLLIALQRMSGG